LALALAARLAAAVWIHTSLERDKTREFVIAGDAAGYWELGRNLASGEGLTAHDPPRRVMRMPGFPALIAVSVRIFGENLLPLRILLAFVGTATCWLVFLLGRSLFDETIGLLAAGWCAVSPVMVGFSPLILSETLFAACMVLSLLAMAKLVQVSNTSLDDNSGESATIWWSALLVGGTIALACLIRPSWLLAAPLFALLLIWSSSCKRRAVMHASVVCLGTLGALLPWVWRNHEITGHGVLTTLWVGPSLYDGLNPDADGSSNMQFFDDENLSARLTEFEVDQTYRQRARAYAVEHPGRVMQLAFAKLWRFWKPWPNAPQFRHWWGIALTSIVFIPLIALAFWGFKTSTSDRWNWLLTVGPAIYFSAIHMIFVASLRYRLPVEYPLSVLSAVGLRNLWLNSGGRYS
jgi:4-amino-4-deoxy-L-arabinose transferase-like glycosyltransferase